MPVNDEANISLLPAGSHTLSRFDSVYTPRAPGQGLHRRDGASSPEFRSHRVFDRHNTRGARPVTNLLTVDTNATQQGRGASLLRRLTTRLLSPISPVVRSPGVSKRNDYANLPGIEHDNVPVDLSSLEGLGFQLSETSTSLEQRLEHEDTSYSGATPVRNVPSFGEFRRRRMQQSEALGSGMQIRTHLRRDPSHVRPASLSGQVEDIQRRRTVRQLAQDLAEQKQEIVAVDETVDVSFFEGAALGNRALTFDSVQFSRTPTGFNKTYLFPVDPDTPNWKPFSMTALYILMLTGLAFALAGVQEALCRISLHRQRQSPKTGLLNFDDVKHVSTWAFFVWKYLPTMITIIYAVLFSIMDFDIRRLEPYYQLSQQQGSPASASLNLDTLTMFQYFIPFNAFKLRQFTVFASTIANIIAATVAPALQNPSVNFTSNPSPNCTLTDTGGGSCTNGEKYYWVVISPVWSRLLTASYIVVGVLGIFLFWKLRRKSGLLSDPKGIAGIAAMATKSHILQDFRGTDLSNRGDLHEKLMHRRYKLYKSSIWQGEWNAEKEAQQDSESRLKSPHPIMLRLVAGIPYIGVLVFCLVAVPIISLTKGRVIPNAAPWLPILVATILKLVWSTFEADVRMMEPFYQLSKGNAKPENSVTLDYQATVYGWVFIKAMFSKHYLVAVVGLTSVALDVLAVTVSSFSVNSKVFLTKDHKEANQDETWASFWTSESLSVLILMLAIVVATTVYIRRRHPFLPREPSTIAAVLAFVYNSKMLDDFIDTERFSNKAMEARLKRVGKTYGLGWFMGRDGKVHCAIDEEPMLSKYKHGRPYTQAVAGPLDHQETFYSV